MIWTFYIKLNPRFTDEEKELGFGGLLKKYSAPQVAKPSFSCDQKLNRIESAICGSTGLAIYDRELSVMYKILSKNNRLSPSLKASQIKWIKGRNNECGGFIDGDQLNACLARTTRARIRYLEYVQSVFTKPIT